MTFEKVGEDLPPLWEYKKAGDSIKGIYLGYQKDVGSKKSIMHSIRVDDEIKNFWGSTVLNRKMMYVKEGEKIRVTFEGMNEKPEYKKFSVEVDKEEVEEETEEVSEEVEDETTEESEAEAEDEAEGKPEEPEDSQ